MSRKKNPRRNVRMDQFKRQIAEEVIGPDGLVDVEIGKGEFVRIKLPVALDESDDYQERLQQASKEEEYGEALSLEVLGHDPDRSAEEQWAAWQAAGFDAGDLALVFQAETVAANERLKAFRYAG
jgi:hypothetical protein